MLTYLPCTDPSVHLQPTALNGSRGAARLQGLPTRQWCCQWDTPSAIHEEQPVQPNVRTWSPCGQVRHHPPPLGTGLCWHPIEEEQQAAWEVLLSIPPRTLPLPGLSFLDI